MSLPYAACIETLFTEAGPRAAQRVRAAAAAGFAAVEMWHWRDKDVPALEDALAQTGVRLGGMVCDPLLRLVDPSTHDAWLEGLQDSLRMAGRLGVGALFVQAGDARPGIPREEQRQALITALSAGAALASGTGVRLLLEPLNTRIDHPGTFLDHTPEGLEVVAAVGRPEVALLYDIYHSVTMGETPQRVLSSRVHDVGHVHLADVPGRHEPGSGGLPWRSILLWLERQGYRGHVGLEYWPTAGTAPSLDELHAPP